MLDGLDAERLDAVESQLALNAADRLNEFVLEACAAVCPACAHTVLALPKERVRPSQKADSGCDFQCHAPATMWRRLRIGLDAAQPMVTVTTVSEYGISRDAVYQSASDLALAIAKALEGIAGARDWVADVRVRGDGCLLLTSQLHMRRQRTLGKLHCSCCGVFCLGERGLRDHQHIMHTGHYEGAKEAVAAAKGAIMPYVASAGGAHLTELWAARAAETERRKLAIPPGLELARGGDLVALRRLVADGADIRNVTDRHGSSALHYAAGAGHLDVCAYLVDEIGVPVVQTQQKDGRAALHWAARNGHADVCEWLIGRGLDPDVGTRDGTRPLHWAVWQGHLAVCDLLLKAGADLHSRNSYGCNAIQWAAQSDTSDGLAVCRWLLERGLDVTVLNCNGHSALHKAAVKGQRAVCEWLLSPEVGLAASHLGPDGDGNTPSLMARLEGFDDLAAYLLEAEQRAAEQTTEISPIT